MDTRDHNHRPSDLRASRPQTIALPNNREGIGNALRSAFDASNWGLPDDMRQLLSRLDR